MTASAVTWRDKLRYRFENTLSKGTIAIIGWLALLSLAIIALASLFLAAMRVGQDPADHEHPYGFFEGMWQSMLRTLDPGVVAGDNGWKLRLLMLLVTIGGIFIVSILIGTITSPPAMTIVSRKLGNVPQYKINAFEYYRTYPYRTDQWYKKDAAASN